MADLENDTPRTAVEIVDTLGGDAVFADWLIYLGHFEGVTSISLGVVNYSTPNPNAKVVLNLKMPTQAAKRLANILQESFAAESSE